MKLQIEAVLLALLGVSSCEGHANATTQPLTAAAAQHGKEEKVPLEAVPRNVIDAASAAVPGLVIEQAERELERGLVVYELSGKANGKRVEVEVSAEGKVLEVENGGDDGKDDDDQDDDGKDDDDQGR
jgi:uncharacterized membrane protein YkoI